MQLISKTYWGGAPMNMRRLPDAFDLESLILKAPDFREHRALYWTPKKNPKPKTGIVVMHPRADFTHHYVIPRLVDAGIACLGANSRNPNNDVTTIHEEIILDVASAVSFLKNARHPERDPRRQFRRRRAQRLLSIASEEAERRTRRQNPRRPPHASERRRDDPGRRHGLHLDPPGRGHDHERDHRPVRGRRDATAPHRPVARHVRRTQRLQDAVEDRRLGRRSGRATTKRS